MRLVVSLLTAVCFLAAAEASATGVAAPQSQAAPSPSTIDIIKQGDNGIEVKCADDKPTRACADITMQFPDRLLITQSPTTGSAPQG